MRFIVGPGDGSTVGDIVARAGGDARAIAEGRVFVGRRRALRDDEPVAPGDQIDIAPPRAPAASVSILHRDRDLVVVDKPAGMPTIPDQSGAAHSLLHVVSEAVKPNAAHPTSRLDREVSGVVVFAISRDAIARTKRARDEGTYARRYVAIACGAPESDRGVWDQPIGRAPDPRRRMVAGKDAVAARTRFAIAARTERFTLLALAPETGRTHQLRVHSAHAGAPLLGDRVYGGAASVTLPGGRVVALSRVALHAARVQVPGARGALVFTAPVPAELRSVWLALGGDDAAWDIAMTCDLS